MRSRYRPSGYLDMACSYFGASWSAIFFCISSSVAPPPDAVLTAVMRSVRYPWEPVDGFSTMLTARRDPRQYRRWSPTPSVDPEDQVGREVGGPGAAAEAHRRPDLLAQDLEGAGDAGGAVGGEAPQDCPPYRHHLRPARQCLHHVGTAREAAVDHDLGATGHGIHDGRQRLDGRLRVVELAAAVVGDPDQATIEALPPIVDAVAGREIGRAHV